MLGKQFGDDQFTWWMQWANRGIRKAKEDMVRLNLTEARSLEGLDALGRLGLEGLLLFVYPNFILSRSFHRLEGDREVLCRVLQFPL